MLKNLFPLGRKIGSQLAYIIWDDFITNRVVGAIHGTPAEPIGGVRSVVDSTGKLSITGNALTYAAGGVNNQDRLFYPAVPRAKGLMLIASTTAASNSVYIGFDTDTAGPSSESVLINSVNLFPLVGGVAPLVAILANNSTYQICYISRGTDGTTGSYILIKGTNFPTWQLVWAHGISSAGATYPTIVRSASTQALTVNYFKVLNPDWFPSPIAYDNFTRTNGPAGSTLSVGPEGQPITPLAWSGGSIVGNQFLSTPTYGSNLYLNSGFDTDTDWVKGTGWTISGGTANKSAGTQSDLRQNVVVVDKFYEITWDVPTITAAGSFFPIFGNGGWIGRQVNTAPTLGAVSSRWVMSSTTMSMRGSSTIAGTVDNVSVREIDKSSLFRVVTTSTADIFAEVAISMTNGTSAGLVINLDDETNPLNYVIAWHDGVNIHLDKCVNGVLTSLINVTQAYSSLAYMKVTKFGTKYRLYYTNAAIGTEQTISDASIVSNTRHGIYSTYGGNVFDNFLLLARGTSGEYSALDQF